MTKPPGFIQSLENVSALVTFVRPTFTYYKSLNCCKVERFTAFSVTLAINIEDVKAFNSLSDCGGESDAHAAHQIKGHAKLPSYLRFGIYVAYQQYSNDASLSLADSM